MSLISFGKTSIILSGLMLMWFVATRAQAAAGDLEVKNQQYKFTINGKNSSSWEGIYPIPQGYDGSIIQTPLSLENTIGIYIGLPDAYRSAGTPQIYHHDPGRVYAWVKGIAPALAARPQEPEMTISDNRVTSFTPPIPGQTLNAYRTSLNILEALDAKKNYAELVTNDVQPEHSLAEFNKLGIKELIGRGESSFARSPRNRRVNIHVGVDKMKGVIIAPGETFSFNKYLGPVEADQGFVPELVIKGVGQGTIPELGGGLCQVSSTTFRAAMDAGLKIVERRNHAYAVQYYAPQGTDATIYPGVVDLKFLNDTSGAILVWPYFKDEDTLLFDLYGTKDDRQIMIDPPIQYDRKADGSMKATWTRTVVNHGETLRDTFNSVYRSPALYHKEEKFVSETGTQTPPGIIFGSPDPATPPTTPGPDQIPEPAPPEPTPSLNQQP